MGGVSGRIVGQPEVGPWCRDGHRGQSRDSWREIPFRPTKHPLLGDDSRARFGDEGPDPAVDGSRL